MIQQIITDAKAMEAETIRSEEDAQKAYEDFVKETNASIETKSKEIVNKSEEAVFISPTKSLLSLSPYRSISTFLS